MAKEKKSKTVVVPARSKAVARGKKDVALAGAKGGQSAALGKLAPVAREINIRLEKAKTLDGKADDHRLAAAKTLERARAMCRKAKIPFRSWVDDNVAQGYREVEKLVAVGASRDPIKALADLRGGAAKRMRKLREREKEEKTASRDATAAVISDPFNTGKSLRLTQYEMAEQTLAVVSDKDALTLMESKAKVIGMCIVSEKDAEGVKQAKRDKPGEFATLDEVKKGFRTLKASDRGEFARWAAADVGLTVADPFREEGDTPVPEKLRRTRGDGAGKEA